MSMLSDEGRADFVTDLLGDQLYGASWQASPGQVAGIRQFIDSGGKGLPHPLAVAPPLIIASEGGMMGGTAESQNASIIQSIARFFTGEPSLPNPASLLPYAQPTSVGPTGPTGMPTINTQGIGSILGPVGTAVGTASTLKELYDQLTGNNPKPKTNGTGPAPKATFFGGECPPGMVRRNISFGRDTCVRKPRMNVLNPHALSRARRRVDGFAGKSIPILKQLGFQVSKTRHAKVKAGRGGRRKAGCGCK